MKIVSVLAISMTFLSACSFVTSSPLIKKSPEPDQALYSISGTLHPAKEITVPANTRILVIWLVIPADSEASDYSYVFGEGSVDFTNYTFVIHFHGLPPKEALMQNNGSSYGIGYVVLTANHSWHKKSRGHAFQSRDIIGIAANQTVVYIDGDFDMFPSPPWLANFAQGYNVGQEFKPLDPFDPRDRYKPVAPDTVQIIIDDIDNIQLIHPMW